MAINVIPTTYKDIVFRSRNEARWAVFFDLIGEAWEYEPQRYELRSGSYLPDFLLPNAYGGVGMWIECKPMYPNRLESWLAAELAGSSGLRVAVVWGSIGRFSELHGPDGDAGTRVFWGRGLPHCPVACPDCDHGRACRGGPDLDDVTYMPCRCPKCFTLGFEFECRGRRICRSRCNPDDPDGYGGETFEKQFMLASTYHFRMTHAPHRDGRFDDGEDPDVPF